MESKKRSAAELKPTQSVILEDEELVFPVKEKKSEPKKAATLKTKNSRTREKIYRCKWRKSAKCPVEAKSIQEIQEHQIRFHMDYMYQCNLCSKEYQFMRDLQAHQLECGVKDSAVPKVVKKSRDEKKSSVFFAIIKPRMNG